MKYKIKVLFILTMLLLFPHIVAADQIDAKDIELECVYDNGVVITAFKDGEYYGMGSSDMKLSNALTPPYNTALTYFYNESSFSKRILDSMECPTQIGYLVVKQMDDSDNSVTFQVYYHRNDYSYLNNSTDQYDEDFFKSQIVPGFTPTDGDKVTFEIQKDSALFDRIDISLADDETMGRAFKFNLVAERMYFNNNVQPNKQWAFKSEGMQAASNPTYIRVYEYTTPGGSTIKLAEKSNTLSRISLTGTLKEHDDAKTIFVCFQPTVKEIDTEKTDMAYKFSSIRHKLEVKSTKANSEVTEGNNGIECSAGYSLYREVNWDEVQEEDDNGTSICDVIPETALLIAKIINYARILVPAILIILTAIDITKIVLTGEIEEELPKRRKLIITRFVIAAVFFFLPIFVQLFISSSYGIDFGDISCLW